MRRYSRRHVGVWLFPLVLMLGVVLAAAVMCLSSLFHREPLAALLRPRVRPYGGQCPTARNGCLQHSVSKAFLGMLHAPEEYHQRGGSHGRAFLQEVSNGAWRDIVVEKHLDGAHFSCS